MFPRLQVAPGGGGERKESGGTCGFQRPTAYNHQRGQGQQSGQDNDSSLVERGDGLRGHCSRHSQGEDHAVIACYNVSGCHALDRVVLHDQAAQGKAPVVRRSGELMQFRINGAIGIDGENQA